MPHGLQVVLGLLRIAAGISLLGPGFAKLGWFAHPALERLPIAHREPDIAQHAPQVGRKLLAAARICAVELEIHHRFAAALVAAQGLDRSQLAV